MTRDSIVYAEVFEILSYMDKKIVMKIPLEILELLKREKDDEYISRIDKNDIFNVENIDQRTIDLITWFNINYWASNKKREELIEKCKNNDEKIEIQKREKYNPSNLFERKNNSIQVVEDMQLQEERISIIEKIKYFLNKFFNY